MMKNVNAWYCTPKSGGCLLWDGIISFLSGTELGQNLSDAKCDILYLLDIFDKQDGLNKDLQGKILPVVLQGGDLAAFNGKLRLFWSNLGRREFAQFSSLGATASELTDDDLQSCMLSI